MAQRPGDASRRNAGRAAGVVRPLRLRGGSRAAVVAIALSVGTGRIAAAAPLRDAVDEEDFDRMRAIAPHAADLLERGEAKAIGGDPAPAEALLRQARDEYPDGPLVLRRDCETLTVLGRRKEAVLACSRALQSSQSNANFRAMVRALVDGPAPPDATDLADALTFVARERERAPKGSAVPAAAACDIAESVGDGLMLQRCAEELSQDAPDDPDTRRALDLLACRCPPWRFWTGWGALCAAVAVTLGHALRRFRRRNVRATSLAVTVWLFFSWLPNVAQATDNAEGGYLSKWPVDDAAPATKIPTEKERDADPLEFGYWLQDVALKADRASNRGDHAAAARFYQALATAVPDRAVGFTKMCSEYEAMGDREHAEAACGAALLRDGLMVKDYVHFVHVVLAKPGPPTDTEAKSLEQVLAQMKRDPAGREAADDVECQIATRTSNRVELEECTQALVARAPNDPETVSYQWALAIEQGRFDEAEVLITRGRALGLQDEGAANMLRATRERASQHRRRLVLSASAVALLLLGIALAVKSLLGARKEWHRV